jgi:hypothetical protein
MADLAGSPPRDSYLGATAAFLEAPLARAAGILADGVPVRPTTPLEERT